MYRISKQFHFSAAHHLDRLPDGHPCKRLHGHNYVVEVVLESGDVDERGFVADYYDLEAIRNFIDETLDHRNLNEVMSEPTTAENIARFLYDTFKPAFPMLVMMRVSETPRTWAEYRP